MKRLLGNFILAVSTLLFLCTLALWVRSFWCFDHWTMTYGLPPPTYRWRQLVLQSDRGTLSVHGQWCDDKHTKPSPKPRPGWAFDYATFGGFNLSQKLGPVGWFPLDADHTHRAAYQSVGARFPLWPVALISLGPATAIVAARRHRCRVVTPGLCLACGYDLRVQLAQSEHAEPNGRATPHRCPECGAGARVEVID